MKLKNFDDFIFEWENDKVYDTPYFYAHAKTINGIYNGFNYHQMQRIMFSTSQLLFLISALNKSSNSLAKEGMDIVEPLMKFIEQIGSWENEKGIMYKDKSNHYKNIQSTMKQNFGHGELTQHDKAVLRPKDIKNYIDITIKWLIDMLEFFRDSDFESNFGTKNDKKNSKTLDLMKLNDLINKIEQFNTNLKKKFKTK